MPADQITTLLADIATARKALSQGPDEGFGGVKASYLDELFARVERDYRARASGPAEVAREKLAGALCDVEFSPGTWDRARQSIARKIYEWRKDWRGWDRLADADKEALLAKADEILTLVSPAFSAWLKRAGLVVASSGPAEVAREKLAAVIADMEAENCEPIPDQPFIGRSGRPGAPTVTWTDLKALSLPSSGSGYREELEAAARWHEEQAAEHRESADRAGESGNPTGAEQAQGHEARSRQHQWDATAIRALPVPEIEAGEEGGASPAVSGGLVVNVVAGDDALIQALDDAAETTDGEREIVGDLPGIVMRQAANRLRALLGKGDSPAPSGETPSPHPLTEGAPTHTSGTAPEERGWLAERPGNPPCWWTGTEWTRDSLLAMRFARRQDAEAYMADAGWTEVVATEHIWCDALPSHETPQQAHTSGGEA